MKYIEVCPQGDAKPIEFQIQDDRIPVPTHGCICGKGNMVERLAAVVTMLNAVKAIGDSILDNGSPKEYVSYAAPSQHDSVITAIG